MLLAFTVFYIVIMIIVCSNTFSKKLVVTKRKFSFLLSPFKHDSLLYTLYWPCYLIKLTVQAFLQSIIYNYATGPLVIQAGFTGLVRLNSVR